jgi:lipopolysaccharide heptosyltransferase I
LPSDQANNTAPNILLIRLSALGDLVQTLHLPKYIKQIAPGSKIFWLSDSKFADYLSFIPDLDGVFHLPVKKLLSNLFSIDGFKEFIQAITDLKSKVKDSNIQIAIDAQGLFKSALLALLSGAKKRVGFAHNRELTKMFYTHTAVSRPEYFCDSIHHLEHMLTLVRLAFGFDSTNATLPEASLAKIDEATQQNLEKLLSFDNNKKIVGLSIATLWESKKWPQKNWQELIEQLLKQSTVNLAFFGSEEENKTVLELLNKLPKELHKELESRALILCGQTSFLELQYLLSLCHIFVSADTGPAHLAAALNKPQVISLFGATSPARTGPLGKFVKTMHTQQMLECMPCHKRTCKLQDKNLCLSSISPAEVFKEIVSSLG